MATTGSLDSIYSRLQAYLGEFFSSRQQLLDAGDKLNQAISVAQGSGSAKIGEKTFSLAELQSLSARNTELLEENADLQTRIYSFQDAYQSVASGATAIADSLVTDVDPDYPWYDMPGLLGESGTGLGVLPGVMVPAVYLVGVGAVLATTVYLFLSNVKSHLGSVAGSVGSNLIIYGGAALLLYFVAKKKGLF